MKVEFEESTHTYRVNGQEVPSVTTICRFLNYDVKSDRPMLVREAADRGSRVHAACAAIDWGIDPNIEPDTEGYINAYCRFLEDYAPEWDGIEISLGIENEFAGTIDRYGTMSGERVVLDIKTGSKVNVPYVDAQLAAYSMLIHASELVPLSETMHHWCLKLGRDGTYKLFKTGTDSTPSLFPVCKQIHEHLSRKGTYK